MYRQARKVTCNLSNMLNSLVLKTCKYQTQPGSKVCVIQQRCCNSHNTAVGNDLSTAAMSTLSQCSRASSLMQHVGTVALCADLSVWQQDTVPLPIVDSIFQSLSSVADPSSFLGSCNAIFKKNIWDNTPEAHHTRMSVTTATRYRALYCVLCYDMPVSV